MNFGDLVRRPELSISVLVPGDNALERQVTGVYTTDLPDPSRFLSVGDLVLTSGLWVSRPGGIEKFIGALARQRVAALIIGLIDLGSVPDEIIEMCRERHLTLATIAENVSFKMISDVVANGQPGSTSGLLARGVRFNRQLADVLGRGGGALAALQLFREEFSIACWVMDDVGTVVATVGNPPTRSHVATVWNHMLARDGADVAIVPDTEDRPFSAWPVGVNNGRASGYLVCWGDHRTFSPEVSIVIEALIGALRVELELASRWRDSRHNQVAELVQVLIDDSVSAGEVSARMRLEGLDPQIPTSVVVAEVEDDRFPVEAVLEMTLRIFSSPGTAAIGCVNAGRVVLLVNGVPEDGESLEDSVMRHAEEYLPLLADRQLRMGVSDPISGLSRLSSGVTIARDRLAALNGVGPVLVSSASDSESYRSLLGMLGERTRIGFATEVLRPLTDYDKKSGGDLVGTLRAFLDSGGAWVECARQLHLHPNTLRYRIGRIEDLTERDLGTMEDRVDLYLALACLPEAVAPATPPALGSPLGSPAAGRGSPDRKPADPPPAPSAG
jgi:sugar diacid utilization regulator